MCLFFADMIVGVVVDMKIVVSRTVVVNNSVVVNKTVAVVNRMKMMIVAVDNFVGVVVEVEEVANYSLISFRLLSSLAIGTLEEGEVVEVNLVDHNHFLMMRMVLMMFFDLNCRILVVAKLLTYVEVELSLTMKMNSNQNLGEEEVEEGVVSQVMVVGVVEEEEVEDRLICHLGEVGVEEEGLSILILCYHPLPFGLPILQLVVS